MSRNSLAFNIAVRCRLRKPQLSRNFEGFQSRSKADQPRRSLARRVVQAQDACRDAVYFAAAMVASMDKFGAWTRQAHRVMRMHVGANNDVHSFIVARMGPQGAEVRCNKEREH
jgi:glucuronate isomerase